MTWVIVAALALGALGLLAEMLWTTPPGGISPRGIGLGLCVTLLGGVGAAALISVDVRPPPEQRGIGVVVEGIEEPTEQRAFDAGLTLSMAAEVDECGEPVDVRLTLAPTAEFWIDNRRDLARSATVRFAIPDGLPADADVGEVLDGLRAWTGNGFAPFATGVPTDPVDADLELTATKAAHAVFVEVDVPRWGEVLTPLTLRFRADWTSGRSVLEGCYVTLPAVAGLPTVLSTAQLTGDAYARDTEDDDGTVGVFVVVSEEAGLEAGYDAKLEVARGVTSLDLGDHVLQGGATFPAPDSNFGSAPAWTCRSALPRSLDRGRLEEGAEATDLYFPVEALASGTISFSARQQEALLAQGTCASFVAIEGASAGTTRDLGLIVTGTVIAFGIELFRTGVRRRRREAAPAGPHVSGTSP
ncbi:hypothetical protein Q9S36_39090 [Microbacterium sp. ARD31]|uniref:hypothetical protein n=1 Tax=Microbacterium sp. ARD31 TaxID=2962576 RepID=UPI002881988C|nr:hypothetical protein [Microbacterium sp. ARD31]MDT0186210.1 hypothetical protein [Microbacterium sp. ARD31]